MSSSRITRRTFAASIAAASVVTSLAKAAPVRSTHGSIDPIADLPMIYRKLRYTTTDGVVLWWFTGAKYGQRDAKFQPMYGVETCNWNRVKQLPDGGFSVTVLECAFYTDLSTGKVLRRLDNPYTGRAVEIPYAVVGPVTAQYDAKSNLIPLSEIGGSSIRMKTANGPVTVLGDTVWMKTRNDFQLVPKSGGAERQVNEWATYVSNVGEITDPAVTSILATVDLVEVTTWPKWLDMAGQPGAMMGQISGQKVSAFGDMPQDFRRRLAEVFPAVAKDPIAALDRPEAELVH
ncbi:MAG: DUF1838 family protein [Chromatiaceae bacterium]